MSRPIGRGNFGPGAPINPILPMGMNPPVPQRAGAVGGFPPAPPRPSRGVEPKVTYVRALYDFNGEEASELTFKEGTIFILLKKDASGWWEGDLGTRTGWFPPDFVEILPTGYIPPANQAEPSTSPNAPLPPPKRSTVTIKADSLAAEFAKMKQEETEKSSPTPQPEPVPDTPTPAPALKPNPVSLNPFLLGAQSSGGAGMGRGFPVQQKFNREPVQPVVKESADPPQPISPPVPERKQSISQDTPPEIKPVVAPKMGFSPVELPKAPIGGPFPRKLSSTNSASNVLKNTPETTPSANLSPPEVTEKPIRKMSIPSQGGEVRTPTSSFSSSTPATSTRKSAPSRSAPPPPEMKFEEKQYASVLYPFNSESDNELSVKERSIVEILSREVQWCEVQQDDQSGWVPACYLRLIPSNQLPLESDSGTSQSTSEIPPPEPPKPENHLEALSTDTKRLEVPGRAKMAGKRPPTRKPRSDKVEADDIFNIPTPTENPKDIEPIPLPADTPSETKPAQTIQEPAPKVEPVDDPIPRPSPLGSQPKVFSGANMNELTAAIRKRSESNAGPVQSIDERVANRTSRAGTLDQSSEQVAPVNPFAMFQQAGAKKTDSVSGFPVTGGLKPTGGLAKPIAPSGTTASTSAAPKPITPSVAAVPKPITPSGPSVVTRSFVKSDRPVLPAQPSSPAAEPEKKEPIASRFQPGMRSVGASEPVKSSSPLEEMKARNLLNRAAPPPAPAVPAFDPDLYVAIHNYDAQSATELTIKNGDVIKVKTRDPSGWWEGDCNGKSGWFPQGFVQQKS